MKWSRAERKMIRRNIDEVDEDIDDRYLFPPRWKKLRREGTVDRISALPDSLLVHILSFLPIEAAIETEVLSKRWQYVWTYLPTLLFRSNIPYSSDGYASSSSSDDGDGTGDFVRSVDKTLILCKCSTLKKFGVDFSYEPRFASNVNLWTRFAARNCTEELRLELHTPREEWEENARYVLPQHLYTNSSFRELRFSSCRVMPKAAVNWKSLKKLSLGSGKLSEDVIQKILVGSPVLEILELYYFCGVNRLDVSNASVKKLILREVWGWMNEGDFPHCELEISIPNLQSLEILGDFEGTNCRLVDATSLVEATLNFNLANRANDKLDDYERHRNTLKGLLESLVNVKNITLGTWAIQVLSITVAKGLRCPLLKCECLTLDMKAKVCKSELPGIANLLESSHSLETLVITMFPQSNHEYFCDTLAKLYNFDENHYWTSQKRSFKCLMLYLKKVEFSGLRWYQLDYIFSFAQFLLKNARVLQKMVISMYGEVSDNPKKVFQAAQKLLSFPRSSSDAVVMFYA